MFLLLDENIARCVARGGTLYTAQRSVAVRQLGYGATDHAIYNFVKRHDAVLVTQDRDDFAALVLAYGPIPIIVLPSVDARTQHAMLRHVAPIAERIFTTRPGSIVEVAPDGRIRSFRVRPPL